MSTALWVPIMGWTLLGLAVVNTLIAAKEVLKCLRDRELWQNVKTRKENDNDYPESES